MATSMEGPSVDLKGLRMDYLLATTLDSSSDYQSVPMSDEAKVLRWPFVSVMNLD